MLPGLGELKWFLDWAISLGRRRGERVDAAVTTVGKALVETELYLRDRVGGLDRVQVREDEIVRLWRTATEALRHIDEDFARAAAMKAQYWLNPDAWSDNDAAIAEIAIFRITNRYYDLMDMEKPTLREVAARSPDDIA